VSAFEYEIPNASISEAQLDFDPATQAELDAHITDATDAHDASAISIIDAAGDFTATEVEGALAELQSDAEADAQALSDHLADAADAHDASAISVLDTGGDYTATDVEGVLAEIAGQLGGGGSRSIPVDLTTPRTSTLGGNVGGNIVALTDYDAPVWEFLKDVEGKLYGYVRVPSDYASGGVIRLALAANQTSANVTRMQLATKAVADGESLNPTLTDESGVDVTMPTTAYQRKDVTFTLTETLAAGDLLIVEVFHDGDHANDTLTVSTLLWGAWLEYTA
jgi:hypothetical protein